MRRFLLAAFVLTLLAACQPATTELTEDQKAEIAAEVTAFHADVWDTWRAADYDRGVSFFNQDELQFAFDGAVMGFSGFDQMWRPAFANMTSQTVTIAESRTTVLAPDVVCIMESGTFASTDTLGVTSPEQNFAFTGIYVRSDGEWKLHLVHESTPAPVADTM